MKSSLVVAEGIGRRFGAPGMFGGGRPIQAVSDVNLSLARGETLGLVGESGSGKSTIGRLLLGLQPLSAGRVMFDGVDLSTLGRASLRGLRRRMQLIFQDPFSSLDPRRRVGAQISDGMRIHRIASKAERQRRVQELLVQVGLQPNHADRFPHAFSGGQRQRIAIARALATQPEFIVADEPVSALDVSVQAQVMSLLVSLRAELGLTMLFISHDLPVVRHLCDRVMVLYLGRVMEEGPVGKIFTAPRHPYTQALLSAAPSLERTARPQRIRLSGEPPSPLNPPSGCVFRTRCPHALPACADAVPPLRHARPGHRVACIRDDLTLHLA